MLRTHHRFRLSRALASAAFLLGACGGRTVSELPEPGDSDAVVETGGTSHVAAGRSGGSEASPMGGAGGNGGPGFGSAVVGFVGGAAPFPTTPNGGTVSSCANVTCPGIPTTCRQLIQVAGACCASCADTGCAPCGSITCPSGTHLETLVGDCCPSCVQDPPDACAKGTKDYATIRDALLDKYGSLGCGNSTDCVMVTEYSRCYASCGYAVPRQMAGSLQSNLDSTAQSLCSACEAPPPVPCPALVPSCVNGKCVTVP